MALTFTFISLIALVKHRFFEIARTVDLQQIQEKLKEELKKEFGEQELKRFFREIKWKTKDIVKDTEGYPCIPRGLIQQISAYKLLRDILLVSIVFIGVLLLLEILSYLGFKIIMN